MRWNRAGKVSFDSRATIRCSGPRQRDPELPDSTPLCQNILIPQKDDAETLKTLHGGDCWRRFAAGPSIGRADQVPQPYEFCN